MRSVTREETNMLAEILLQQASLPVQHFVASSHVYPPNGVGEAVGAWEGTLVGVAVVGAVVGDRVGALVGEAVGASTQYPPMHVSLLQSELAWHFRPAIHGGQIPPQSTSVSVLSCFPLLQTEAVGAGVVGAKVGELVGALVGDGVASRWQLYT